MEEACVDEHLPDNGMTPIVRLILRVDGDTEIVVFSFKDLGHGHKLVKRDTHEIGTELLEGGFKGSLVIFTLAHGIGDHTVTVSDKQKDSSSVNTIESCNICDRI